MLIPAVYGLAKYRFSLSGDQDEMIVTLGHAVQSFTPTALADALFDALADTLTAGRMGTSWSLRGVDVQVGAQSSGEGPYFNYSSSLAPLVGTSAATRLPQNSAILVRKNTDAPGRRGRGRMYFPAIVTEADVNDAGVLTTAKITDTQTFLNAWHTRLMADALDPVLLHESPPATPDAIVSFTCDGQIATQRRRLRR